MNYFVDQTIVSFVDYSHGNMAMVFTVAHQLDWAIKHVLSGTVKNQLYDVLTMIISHLLRQPKFIQYYDVNMP